MGTGSGLVTVTQNTAGLFLFSLCMYRWKERFGDVDASK